jgi:RimJ/RimL family protein N-acetyltransferase
MEQSEFRYNNNGTIYDPGDFTTWNWGDYDYPLACRALKIGDAQHLYPVMKRSAKILKGYIEWAKYSPSWDFKTVSEFVKDHVNSEFPRFHLIFMIGKQVVGFGSLAPVNVNVRDVQVALWVGLGHQGKGIGNWIVQTLEFYAFNVFGFDRVFYQHDSNNRASGKLPQKLGYRWSHTFDVEKRAVNESGFWYSWVKERPKETGAGFLDLGHVENWAEVRMPWKCLI